MTDQSPAAGPRPDRTVHFDPEDPVLWERGGAALAQRTLWITTAALTLSFVTWFVWSAIVLRLPLAGFHVDVSQRFWLVATPGLVGATLRIPYSFVVQLFGTRLVVTLATATLLVPAIGIGFAVQSPDTPYWVLLALASAAGFGGGNFSAFMASTSLFFPKRKQGTALGVQAGLGNLGVSLVQFSTPWLIGIGTLAIGSAQTLSKPGGPQQVWLQNAAFVWAVPIVLTTLAAAVWLRDAPVRSSLREQTTIFRNPHTWWMTSLYVMTFGTFSGFAATTGLLIGEVFSAQRFSNAPDPLAYAFLGPLIGSAMRPVGGWISDRLGGARVTLGCGVLLVVATALLSRASHPESVAGFPVFLGLLLVIFFASGVGNGSTFRMIPVIFEPRLAAPVLGWTAAAAAYGAFILPMLFGGSLSRFGSPAPALWSLAAFYLANSALCFWLYARPGAEKPC